ncbi:MAG: ATP-binding protein, partial [Proteobacteria bacterium]|nr:ATP-binding protein [Pseudomonadota bacterium]
LNQKSRSNGIPYFDSRRSDDALGLHYPASDIPQPARRQLILNPIRVIADVEDVPAVILSLGEAAGGTPLDLSYSQLRAVSPIHIQYLKNMGVRATLTISLIAKGKLWGLIACHHYQPRRLSVTEFRLCELLGGLLGNFIRSLENTEELIQTMAAEKLAFNLEIGAHSGTDVASLVAARADALMGVVDAEGLVLNCGGRTTVLGKVANPVPDFAALPARGSDGARTFDCLSDSLALSDEQVSVTAGGAILDLSEDGQDFIFFSRPNYLRTVQWAGDPRKSVLRTGSDDGPQSLTPRTSFELWRETVGGRCRPFLPATREALRVLRRALFALCSGERARQALMEKATSEAEMAQLRLQLLDAARQNSLGELAGVMAHELNQPLAALMNYVGACRQVLSQMEGPSQPEIMELIDEAQTEANRAGLLVRRLKGLIESGDLDPTNLDVNQLVVSAAQLAISASSDPEVEFRMEAAENLPAIWADRLQFEQVIFNLVRNSIEAMQDSATKRLTAATREVEGMVEVVIRDTGPGVSDDMSMGLFEAFNSNKLGGMGIGLSLCRRIVRAHGGEIEARQTGEGAEFAFTIPVTASEQAHD